MKFQTRPRELREGETLRSLARWRISFGHAPFELYRRSRCSGCDHPAHSKADTALSGPAGFDAVSATSVEPRSYHLTANIVRLRAPNGSNFTPLDFQPTSRRCKNVASPDKSFASSRSRDFIDDCGRSILYGSYCGRYRKVIETVLLIAFGFIVGVAIVKAYEWHQDVLYGPCLKARRLKQRPR
jgi:hypothetical protein